MGAEPQAGPTDWALSATTDSTKAVPNDSIAVFGGAVFSWVLGRAGAL
jgi:hypothetical protein